MSDRVAEVEFKIESNTESVARDFSDFAEAIKTEFGALKGFETEVKSFSSAMSLALEEPQQSMTKFTSLVSVGIDQIRQGWDSIPRGIATVSLGMQEMAGRIPPLQRFAPVLGK